MSKQEGGWLPSGVKEVSKCLFIIIASAYHHWSWQRDISLNKLSYCSCYYVLGVCIYLFSLATNNRRDHHSLSPHCRRVPHRMAIRLANVQMGCLRRGVVVVHGGGDCRFRWSTTKRSYFFYWSASRPPPPRCRLMMMRIERMLEYAKRFLYCKKF